MTIQKGFTLVELMIVVAIIGVLAAFAVPAYQDYIARSQVSEAVSLAASGKTPMAEYYADKGRWPSAATDVMGNVTGKYVSTITITAGSGLSGSLVLSARMKNSGVNVDVAGATLEMATNDGGKNWICTGGTVGARYRPASCR